MGVRGRGREEHAVVVEPRVGDPRGGEPDQPVARPRVRLRPGADEHLAGRADGDPLALGPGLHRHDGSTAVAERGVHDSAGSVADHRHPVRPAVLGVAGEQQVPRDRPHQRGRLGLPAVPDRREGAPEQLPRRREPGQQELERVVGGRPRRSRHGDAAVRQCRHGVPLAVGPRADTQGPHHDAPVAERRVQRAVGLHSGDLEHGVRRPVDAAVGEAGDERPAPGTCRHPPGQPRRREPGDPRLTERGVERPVRQVARQHHPPGVGAPQVGRVTGDQDAPVVLHRDRPRRAAAPDDGLDVPVPAPERVVRLTPRGQPHHLPRTLAVDGPAPPDEHGPAVRRERHPVRGGPGSEGHGMRHPGVAVRRVETGARSVRRRREDAQGEREREDGRGRQEPARRQGATHGRTVGSRERRDHR